MNKYDVVILGGGPAGYVAAIRLSKMGAKVALVEKDKLGGTCLNRGCIPTKTLYNYSKTIHHNHQMSDIGLNYGEMTIDMVKINQRKNQVVDELVTGIDQILSKLGVDVYKGRGSFVDNHHIKIDQSEPQEIEGRYVIIASGSKPKMLPIEGLQEGIDKGKVLTSKEILDLTHIPKSLTIIGGGVIGMEFAGIFNSFGTKVTVIEAMERILPSFMPDLIKRYKPFAKKQGIEIITKAKAYQISTDDQSVTVFFEGPKGEETVSSELVLFSVGRVGNTKTIGIENTTLQGEHNDFSQFIDTDDFMRTSDPTVYAIGDVNGLSMLAHSASKQGVIVANDILIQLGLLEKEGVNHLGFSHYHVPSCAFLLPSIAEVSNPLIMKRLLEDKKLMKEASTGSFNYRSNGMAKALNCEDGLSKTIYQEDKLIYMGILGEESEELIIEGVKIMDHQNGINELDSITPHPSLGEIIHESLLDGKKEAIHKL